LRQQRFRDKQKLALMRAIGDPLAPYLKLGMSPEEAHTAYETDYDLRFKAAFERAAAALRWDSKATSVPVFVDGKYVGYVKLEAQAPGAGTGTKQEWRKFLAKFGLSIREGDNVAVPMAAEDLIAVDDVQQGNEALCGGGRRVVPPGAGPDTYVVEKQR